MINLSDTKSVQIEQVAKNVGEAARSRVPLSKRIPFNQVLFVWLGYVLVVSSLMAGGTIGSMYPLMVAIPILLLAEILNAIVGSLMGVIGARTGLSTALISRFIYGQKGAFLPNVIMGVLQTGWYGVVLGAFASSGAQVFGFGYQSWLWYFFVILFGILFMIPPLLNIKWVAKLDYIAVPAVIVLFFLVSVGAIGNAGGLGVLLTKDFEWSASLGTGISIAIGSWITGAIIASDFLRFCKSGKDAFKVMLIAFVGCDFIEKVGAALGGAATGQWDLTIMLAEFGFITLGFFALLCATWSTEQNIIYSGALFFAAPPFPNIKNDQELTRRIWVIIGSAVGVIACLVGVTNLFANFLNIISSLVPPLFAVMAIDYWAFKDNRRRYYESEPSSGANTSAIVTTLLGIVTALITERIQIGISALNGIFVAGISYYLVCRFKGENKNREALQ